MSQTTTIQIDIDVHRAIETRRAGFTQTHNDILREAFGLAKTAQEPNNPSPTEQFIGRRTGTYTFELLGDKVEEGSLKAAYISILNKLVEHYSGFLERLSEKSTKSRKIVARNPKELYFRKPHLAEKYAHRLTDQWWVDTNLSQLQCEQRLKTACDVAGLEWGRDLVLDFPS